MCEWLCRTRTGTIEGGNSPLGGWAHTGNTYGLSLVPLFFFLLFSEELFFFLFSFLLPHWLCYRTIAYADKQAIDQRRELPFYVTAENTQLTAQTPILARLPFFPLFFFFSFFLFLFLSWPGENVKQEGRNWKKKMMIPDKEIILNSIVKRDHVKQEKPGKTAMAGSYDLRLCAALFFF
jgi:hypothetical protein